MPVRVVHFAKMECPNYGTCRFRQTDRGAVYMKVKPSSKRGGVTVEIGREDERILTETAAGPSPFRLETILVPLDFSACSKKALQYAVPFARHFGASLVLLNVVQVHYPTGEFTPPDTPALELELREGSQRELDALVEKEIHGQVPTRTLLRTGPAAEEIVFAAEEERADLIIISTHGHTGLKHVLLGSTTEHVVRRAPCPVLTVRENEHDFVSASTP